MRLPLALFICLALSSVVFAKVDVKFRPSSVPSFSYAVLSGVVQPQFLPLTQPSLLASVPVADYLALFSWSASEPGVTYELELSLPYVWYPEGHAGLLNASDFGTTLPASGAVPVGSENSWNVSLECTNTFTAVFLLGFSLQLNGTHVDDLFLSFRWDCVKPGCVAGCEDHGICHTKEATCECLGSYKGYSCNFEMNMSATLCPGDPFAVNWSLPMPRTNSEWWQINHEGGDGAIVVWKYYEKTVHHGEIMEYLTEPPGGYNVWVFLTDSTKEIGALSFQILDWGSCGFDNGCTSDGDCGGTGHGTCTNSQCVCKTNWWFARCSHGCEENHTLLAAEGKLESDENPTSKRKGYPVFAKSSWIIQPPIGDWDSISFDVSSIGLGAGDTLTFFRWDGVQKGEPVLSLSEKSSPGIFLVQETKLFVVFESDYTTNGEGFSVSYNTYSTPAASLPVPAVAGAGSAALVLVIGIVATLLILWRRSLNKVKTLEGELMRKLVSDILGTPAEKAIKTLRSLKHRTFLRAKDKRELETIIHLIGSNSMFKVELRGKLGDHQLGSDVNEFLKDTLGAIDHEDQEKKVHQKSMSLTSSMTAGHGMLDLVAKVDQWDYDVRPLKKHATPLAFMAAELLDRYDLVENLKLDRETVGKFLTRLDSGYNPNPYHSSIHAADVAQCLNYLVNVSQFPFTDIELFSAFIAAFGHDFGHPGVNNTFLQATFDPLSLRFSFTSVLESMHAAETLLLLGDPEMKLLAHLPKDSTMEIFKTVSTLIRSTDLARHVEFMGKLGARQAEQNLSGSNKADRLLVLELFIKFADISNATRPWDLCKFWAEQVMEEFFAQGDKEKDASLPVSAFMDRNTADMEKCQTTFTNFLVVPMVQQLCKLFPAVTDTIMKQTMENVARWTEIRDKKILLNQDQMRTETVEESNV